MAKRGADSELLVTCTEEEQWSRVEYAFEENNVHDVVPALHALSDLIHREIDDYLLHMMQSACNEGRHACIVAVFRDEVLRAAIKETVGSHGLRDLLHTVLENQANVFTVKALVEAGACFESDYFYEDEDDVEVRRFFEYPTAVSLYLLETHEWILTYFGSEAHLLVAAVKHGSVGLVNELLPRVSEHDFYNACRKASGPRMYSFDECFFADPPTESMIKALECVVRVYSRLDFTTTYVYAVSEKKDDLCLRLRCTAHFTGTREGREKSLLVDIVAHCYETWHVQRWAAYMGNKGVVAMMATKPLARSVYLVDHAVCFLRSRERLTNEKFIAAPSLRDLDGTYATLAAKVGAKNVVESYKAAERDDVFA